MVTDHMEMNHGGRERLLYFCYRLLMVLLLPFILLFILGRLAVRPAYRDGIAQRFGWYPRGFFKSLEGKKVFWIHAVSVGEVISSGVLIQLLRERYPKAGLVFSTVTPTGQAAARQRLKGIDCFIYFPFDLSWVTRSVVRRISPALFIFLETEIWPNCLRALADNKTPSLLINGRISERGFRRYRWIRFFLSGVLRQVSLFLMQTERDAAKMIQLGAPPDRVERTGNMKYDQAVSGSARRGEGDLRSELRLPQGAKLMIAGSTHEGEEEAVLEAYSILASSFPRLVLLIAPRHLERLAGVEQLLSHKGYTAVRKRTLSLRAKDDPGAGESMILIDTFGELDRLYSLADFIFVGGSLVPVGGHNVLEAAACRKPVFFGPYMANFQEIADQLKGSGGGIEVRDGRELGEKMTWLAQHPEEYEKKGESAYLVVSNNRGAVKRNLERIARWADPIR
jgi:3-deoxy-D-manno-octulosonic-acid transferase